MTKLTERGLHWAYCLLFFLVPFLFWPKNYELFEFNKMIAVYLLTVIIVSLWLLRMVADGRVIFRRTFLDLPLLLFLASQLTATIFSIDPHISLWGYYSRFNGGLISLICYALLYWAYVSNFSLETNAMQETHESRKTGTHLVLLIISAGIISLYAIMEHFGVSPSCIVIYGQFDDKCWVQDVQTRVFATLGQPNWLAAWLAALIPLTWFRLVCRPGNSGKKKYWENWLDYGLFLVMFLAVIYTKSRSGIVAVLISAGIFWGGIILNYFHNTTDLRQWKHHRNLLAVGSIMVMVFILSGSALTPSLGDLVSRRVTTEAPVSGTLPALEGGTGETGAIRSIVWKGAWDIGLAYPFFGTGVETFAESYYQFRPAAHNTVSEWDFLYNKAHNEFLNYLATTGFIGLGLYLLVISAVVGWLGKRIIRGLRAVGEIRATTALCLALLSGYLTILITNFFGFSVVNVQLLFFLFPGIAVVALNEGDGVTWPMLNKGLTWLKNRGKLSTIGIGLTAIVFLWQIDLRWVADTHYAKALQLFGQSSLQSAFLEARQALEMTPNEPVFADELAQTSGALAIAATQQSESTIAGQLASIAVSASDQAITTSPKNLQFWTARTRILYSLADENGPGNFTDYLNQALAAAVRTTQLAPTHPRMFYQLALIQLKIGQVTEARQSLEKAIDLKPDYKDPRYALALFLAGEKDYTGALDQANYILTKIDPKDNTVRNMAATWTAEIQGKH